jgi:hypothetical protein
MHPLLHLLAESGWRIAPPAAVHIPPHPMMRLSDAAQSFLLGFSTCVSADETVWLFSADDYRREHGAEPGFGWNFIERLGLAASCGDVPWQSEISAFWSRHVPFALSVRGDYGFLAEAGDGRIVEGFCPDEHSVSVVAESFEAFLELAVKQLRERKGALHDLWFSPPT